MIDDWKKDLLKERSLQEVYLVSRKLPKSAFNRAVYIVTIVAVTAVISIWICRSDIQNSARVAVEIAKIAFDLTVQILGFLIGGFAIFATITDPRLMMRLAQTPMPDSSISVFKTVFFNFLSVFYIYVVTLAVSIIVRIAAEVRIIDLGEVLSPIEVRQVLTVVNSVAFGFLALLSVVAVVRLKSFIWNIYQAFLTFLSVTEIMEREEKEQAKGASASQMGSQ